MIPAIQDYLFFYGFTCAVFCALVIGLLKLKKSRDLIGMEVTDFRLANDQLKAETNQIKLREKLLVVSEKKYRTLFQNAPDLIFELNSKGNLTSVNDSFLADYSISPADIIGKPFLELVHPDDLNRIAEAFLKARAAKTNHEMGQEFRFVDRGGGAYWCELNANMEFDENGAYSRAYGVVRNISDRKQTEEALRESEQRYRFLAENIRDIIWIADIEFTRFQYVSPTVEHFGEGLHDLFLSLKIEEMMIPQSYQESRNILIRELESDQKVRDKGDATPGYLNRSVTQEAGFKGLDDTVFWTESTVKFLRDDQKNPTAIFGTTRDINQRKKATEKLQKLFALIDNSQDLIALTDMKGRIQFINSAGLKMVGLDSLKNAENTGFLSYTNVTDTQKLIDEVLPVIHSNQHWVTSIEIRHTQTGDVIPIELSVFLIPGLDSTGTSEIALVGKDLTEKQEMERHLRHSQKMESLGTLAGGIAHDFNNILGTMIGYSELLKGLLPEQSATEEYLEEILRAGSRASDLVRQIQIFSRIEGSSLTPVSLQPIIHDTIGLITSSFFSSITIRESIDTDCGQVSADASQIRQMIVSLCTNAAQAMQDKEKTLEISLKAVHLDPKIHAVQDLPGGDYARLSITDSGIGMDDTVRERIFEPFFTTKGIGEGSGLGLSVVHGIIKNHNGAIEFNSQPGAGTSVSVFLPLLNIDEIERGRSEKPDKNRKAKILVVDDEDPLARFYELALSKLGYDVLRFNNSPDALAAFKAQADTIDLVLTDQIMPQMSGTQLCNAIYKISPTTPVLLITGHPQHLTHKTMESSHAAAMIHKPVKIRVLIETVHKALADRNKQP